MEGLRWGGPAGVPQLAPVTWAMLLPHQGSWPATPGTQAWGPPTPTSTSASLSPSCSPSLHGIAAPAIPTLSPRSTGRARRCGRHGGSSGSQDPPASSDTHPHRHPPTPPATPGWVQVTGRRTRARNRAATAPLQPQQHCGPTAGPRWGGRHSVVPLPAADDPKLGRGLGGRGRQAGCSCSSVSPWNHKRCALRPWCPVVPSGCGSLCSPSWGGEGASESQAGGEPTPWDTHVHQGPPQGLGWAGGRSDALGHWREVWMGGGRLSRQGWGLEGAGADGPVSREGGSSDVKVFGHFFGGGWGVVCLVRDGLAWS